MNPKRYLIEKWTKLTDKQRKDVIKSLERTLNLITTSLFISIPLMLFTSVSWWKLLLGCAIILPFVEHYYVWFREKWKDDIMENN